MLAGHTSTHIQLHVRCHLTHPLDRWTAGVIGRPTVVGVAQSKSIYRRDASRDNHGPGRWCGRCWCSPAPAASCASFAHTLMAAWPNGWTGPMSLDCSCRASTHVGARVCAARASHAAQLVVLPRRSALPACCWYGNGKIGEMGSREAERQEDSSGVRCKS